MSTMILQLFLEKEANYYKPINITRLFSTNFLNKEKIMSHAQWYNIHEPFKKCGITVHIPTIMTNRTIFVNNHSSVAHAASCTECEKFAVEYEKFSEQYKELMKSGFTKPRESQLRSTDQLFEDMIHPGKVMG